MKPVLKSNSSVPPWAGLVLTLVISVIGAWINLYSRVAALETAQAQQTELTREMRIEIRTLHAEMNAKLDRLIRD